MNGYEITLVVAVAIAAAFLGTFSLEFGQRLNNTEWAVTTIPFLVSWLLITPGLSLSGVESDLIIVPPLLLSLAWGIVFSLYFIYVKPAARAGSKCKES